MRRYLRLLWLIVFPSVAWAGPTTSFYVCAHPDDCFLFMSPNLYDDAADPSNKVVIVYLTSGDAGIAFSKKTSSYPYVRELASIEATKWMADADKEPVRAKLTTSQVSMNAHKIDRVSYANTVTYFLRLPDGNMYGDGFKRYHNQSLRKLKSGEIATISPIDGGKAYIGWQDLVRVLENILSRETVAGSHIAVHISEPDIETNYHDHSDHTTGASAVMEALAQMASDTRSMDSCYQIFKHIDYSIAEKQVNLDGEGLQDKSGSFAVLTATQRRYLDSHNWDKAHRPYLTRNYYTTSTYPNGCEVHE